MYNKFLRIPEFEQKDALGYKIDYNDSLGVLYPNEMGCYLVNPRMVVNLNQLRDNASTMMKLCQGFDIKLTAVTKAFCAVPDIARAIMAGGVESLADSRIENLEKMANLDAEKILLRLPMLSEVDEVVRLADISLNSEWDTIKALNSAAGRNGVKHGVLLMFDLGDLREGVYGEEELIEVAQRTIELDYIELKGIGTNLTCFGAVLPDQGNLGRLVNVAKDISQVAGKKLELVSGGNSSSVQLLLDGKMPKGINHLRIGEAILFGTEAAYGNKIPGMHNNCFKLTAELIEIHVKPSLPMGEIGRDAFGQIPKFKDMGIRKRAIAAVGKQDYGGHLLEPADSDILVLGASSDHLILDIDDAKEDYRVGDEITFNLSYGALLALATSPYVAKQYIDA